MQVDMDNRDKAKAIAEHDKRQELRASHIAIVIGCLQEKKKEWEDGLMSLISQSKRIGLSKTDVSNINARINLCEEFIFDLQEIINKNSL